MHIKMQSNIQNIMSLRDLLLYLRYHGHIDIVERIEEVGLEEVSFLQLPRVIINILLETLVILKYTRVLTGLGRLAGYLLFISLRGCAPPERGGFF